MSFTRSITNVCGGPSCHAPLTTLTTVTFCRPENAVAELKLIKSRRSNRGSLAGHHSSFDLLLVQCSLSLSLYIYTLDMYNAFATTRRNESSGVLDCSKNYRTLRSLVSLLLADIRITKFQFVAPNNHINSF